MDPTGVSLSLYNAIVTTHLPAVELDSLHIIKTDDDDDCHFSLSLSFLCSSLQLAAPTLLTALLPRHVAHERFVLFSSSFFVFIFPAVISDTFRDCEVVDSNYELVGRLVF